jgi:hypothetical protein
MLLLKKIILYVFLRFFKCVLYFFGILGQMCKTKKKHSFNFVLFCDLIILLIRGMGMSAVTLFVNIDYLGKMIE